MKTVAKFKDSEGKEFRIEQFNYRSGNPGLILTQGHNNQTLTLDVEKSHVRNDQVIVRDYGESKGALALLKSHGLIKETAKTIRVGLNKGIVANLIH